MLFEIPESVHYFNIAGMSPLPRRTRLIGEAAVGLKSRPWDLSVPFQFFEQTDQARALFANLIGARPEDIALIPSATYGVSTAVKNLHLKAGDEVLLMAEEFPALYYPLRRACLERGATLVTVTPLAGQSWTDAILAKISTRTKAVGVSPCHWTNGARIDLKAIRKSTRNVGAQMIVDGCQWVGAAPFSCHEIEPDHLIVPTYKWMLGPYSFGFHYVAPHLQNGMPLEEYWASKAGADDFSKLVAYTDEFQPGARRFDMGERSNFVLLPMAMESLRILLELTPEKIAAEISPKIEQLAAAAYELGLLVPEKSERSPHMIGIRRPSGWKPGLPDRLRDAGIHVSFRGDCMRVSPHVHIDDHNMSALIRCLESEV